MISNNVMNILSVFSEGKHETLQGDKATSREQLSLEVYNDPEKFLTIYDSHYDEIYHFLFRMTRNSEEAEDLCAQTFLNAYESLTNFPQNLMIRSWLYRIARNLLSNTQRKSQRWSLKIPFLQMSFNRRKVKKPDELYSEKALVDAIWSFVDQMKLPDRIVIYLKYQENLTVKEIASIMELTESACKSRLNRALEKVRAEFKDS